MNSIFERCGLSARREAHRNSKKNNLRFRCTWAFVIIATMLLCCYESANGQNNGGLKKDHSPGAKSPKLKSDSDKPKVSIKVNRHYDDQGNLIGLDSTYSSYYSKVEGDTSKMHDLMKSFDQFFDRNHPLFFDKQFNTFFFDTTRFHDFFHDDFFLKRYELNDKFFKDMMQRLDSIKNRFYKEKSLKEKNSKRL